MTAGFLGQCAVVALVLYLALRLAHQRGFLRGWKARDAKGGAVRIDVPPMQVVRGSYRAKRTPISFPVDPDHQNHVDHG